MYGSWWLCIISEALRNKCASVILSNLPRLGSGLCSYSCMLKSMLSTLTSWRDKQALQIFPMGVPNCQYSISFYWCIILFLIFSNASPSVYYIFIFQVHVVIQIIIRLSLLLIFVPMFLNVRLLLFFLDYESDILQLYHDGLCRFT
jgi:hypothetical protein